LLNKKAIKNSNQKKEQKRKTTKKNIKGSI